MHRIFNGYYYCIFFPLPRRSCFSPLCCEYHSSSQQQWCHTELNRQGIKTELRLNRSISKLLQRTEILSSATIIFNEAGLLLESWQKTVIYSSPRATTANWANTKITCNVKSACAYHYTKKPGDVLGKRPVKLSCLLMKRTVLFRTSLLYQI